MSFEYEERFLRTNENPLQYPGKDRLLRTVKLGGPETGRDTRMMLSVKELEALLEVARKSPVQRVLIHQAGIRVDVYAHKSGHQYEVWRLTGRKPEAERPAIVDALMNSGTSVG